MLKKTTKKVAAKKPAVKMYQDGGKKKPVSKAKAYSNKSSEREFSFGNTRLDKSYKATKSGKVISVAKEDLGTGEYSKRPIYTETTTIMDTTGYAKGKKSFPVKRNVYDPFAINYRTLKSGESKGSSFEVPRSKVEKVIKDMKANTGMVQKEKAAQQAKEKAKKTQGGMTKTTISKSGKKTTKSFKPVSVKKEEAFKNGGVKSQPKPKSNTMYNLGKIHTGSAKTDPGILKAQAEKAKRDSIAKAYKAKKK